jgi:hypothetical protein
MPSERNPHRRLARFISMRASAKHGSTIYQVVGNVENLNTSYCMPECGSGPLDLAGLRIWIDRMVRDYESILAERGSQVPTRDTRNDLRHLEGLQQALTGGSSRKNGAKDLVLRLVVSGVVQFSHHAREYPRGVVPEQLVIDMATFALWPLIEASVLPDEWAEVLAEASSPLIATVVEAARSSRAHSHDVTPDRLGAVLSRYEYGPGIACLLGEMADPRRSGPLLSVMAFMSGVEEPPLLRNGHSVVYWLLGGVAAGVASDHIAEQVFDQLSASASGGAQTTDGSLDEYDDSEHWRHNHSTAPHVGSGSHPQSSGFISQLIDDLVNGHPH